MGNVRGEAEQDGLVVVRVRVASVLYNDASPRASYDEFQLVLVLVAALHSCMFHCFDWLATSG